MIKILGALWAVSLVLYAGLCIGAENKSNPQLVKALMNKSGLNKQLEQMPLIIQAGMVEANQETQALSPDALEEVGTLAARVFDARSLQQTVQKHIQENLPEEDTREVLAWLDSPLGLKIARLDEESATPEAYIEMLKMAEQLTVNPARVELVRRLDKAIKATETGVDAAMSTQTALIIALTSRMNPEHRPSLEDIENEVKKNKEELRSEVEEQNALALLYSYRKLKDDEIVKYVEFAESRAGKRYHAVVASGFTSALANATRNLGERVEEGAAEEEQEPEKKQIKSETVYSANALFGAARSAGARICVP